MAQEPSSFIVYAELRDSRYRILQIVPLTGTDRNDQDMTRTTTTGSRAMPAPPWDGRAGSGGGIEILTVKLRRTRSARRARRSPTGPFRRGGTSKRNVLPRTLSA